jgi:hypothetical protein
MGGVATIGEGICADPRERLPGRNKKRREGLSLLVATMLEVRREPDGFGGSVAAGGGMAGHALSTDQPDPGQ